MYRARVSFKDDSCTASGLASLQSDNEEREKKSHAFGPEVIERQLAHCEKNEVKAAYNRASHLEARKDSCNGTVISWTARLRAARPTG